MRSLHAQIKQNFSYAYEGRINDQLMVGSTWERIIGLWIKLRDRNFEHRGAISDELWANRNEEV